MSHLANESPDRVARQPGVGVEGDHIANARGRHGWGQECGVRRAAQQSIKFVNLSALALPSDPAPLAFTPLAPAVQQQKTIAAGRGAIASIQSVDTAPGDGQQFVVVGLGLAVRVTPIGEKRKMELTFGAGQKVDFELLDLGQNRLRRGQDRRHGDQRAQIFRHAVAQIERRQKGGAKSAGHHLVDPGDGQIQRRNKAQNAQQDEERRAYATPGTQPKGQRQQAGRDDNAGADITTDAERAIEPLRPGVPRRVKADIGGETSAPRGDQIVARIALARVPPVGVL